MLFTSKSSYYRRRYIRWTCGTGLLVATVTLLAAVTTGNPSDDSYEKYCTMVQLYLDSKGEAGWPAYRGTTHCPDLNP